MTIDWTLNVWQVITAVGFLFGGYSAVMRVYHLVDKRLASMEQHLTEHAGTIGQHGQRLEKYEQALFKLVGDLQRVVGRVEAAGPTTTRQ